VLDEDGNLESRCNMAMVDLEPVTGALGDALGHVKDDMRTHDAERLHRLLQNHARYTNSQRAQDILADWETYLPKFRKVMPTEYRRALNDLAESETAEQPAAGE
jgi:glutamate synthase (NADPH/NADH) large chain